MVGNFQGDGSRWTDSGGHCRPDPEQTGGSITGTAGPGENEQHAIAKGKIEGDKITLETDDGVKLDLVLAGERIAGDVTVTGENGTIKAKLDVGRAK